MVTKAYYYRDSSIKELVRYFYEYKGFYHSIDIDKQYPFLTGNHYVIKEGDVLYKSLKAWANFKMISLYNNESVNQELLESTNKVGIYYPRMWRGSYFNLNADKLGGSRSVVSKSKLAVELLFDKLLDLFEYVEPQKENLNVFGPKIRELLLLSCMEVESSLTAVLKANSYRNSTDKLTTNDYVLLLDPMRLGQYEVQLIHFPEIGIVKPFELWDKEKPTQSIKWYDAYNKTKHNREENLHFSKLKYAIEAVCASVVLICAQFGPRVVPREFYIEMREQTPDWFYIPKYKSSDNYNENGSINGINTDVQIKWEKEYFPFD